MTTRRFYALSLLALVVGLVAIVLLPDAALVVLSFLVPVSIVGAILATAYLYRVYGYQAEPRSRFFRMLVETFVALVAIGLWIGYLTVARISQRLEGTGEIDWSIPAPPASVSSPISALVVVIVFGAPIRFALEVYRRRRAAGNGDETLDREDPAVLPSAEE